MRNTFNSPFELPSIRDLKSNQEKQIAHLVNNLKIDDVRTDEKFDASKERIKMAVQITPIVFEDPKFVDHEYEQRTLSFEQQVRGMSRNNYTHTVSFSYTGDSTLLKYKPMSFSYSSSEHGLVNGYGQTFLVYVELPELDPQKAIAEAKDLMSMILRIADDNSSDMIRWNQSASMDIDHKMTAKREELLRIFGK